MALVLHPVIYIFLSLFVLASNQTYDFNNRNNLLTALILKYGYWYNETFSRFYRRHIKLSSEVLDTLISTYFDASSLNKIYNHLITRCPILS